MKYIKMILQRKIKNIRKKINDKFSELFDGLYEILFKQSLTKIGSLITEVRSECYVSENGDFDIKEYMKRLYSFYYNEFEENCLSFGWNYNKELLIRRKELKNKSNFLANVNISFVTGVLAGLLANNINKLSFLMSEIDDNIWTIIAKSTAIFILPVMLVFIPIFLFILFKNSITIMDPIIEYTKEIEIEIIEKLLRNNVDWKYDPKLNKTFGHNYGE